jgi:hypothetical protein
MFIESARERFALVEGLLVGHALDGYVHKSHGATSLSAYIYKHWPCGGRVRQFTSENGVRTLLRQLRGGSIGGHTNSRNGFRCSPALLPLSVTHSGN